MLMIARPNLFGLFGPDATLPYRCGFFVVGVWWLLFSIPTFLWVHDKPLMVADGKGTNVPGIDISLRWTFLFHTFRHLKESFQTVYQIKNAFRFLVAYAIFNDGIQTILL